MTSTTLASRRRWFTPERFGSLVGAVLVIVVALVALGRFPSSGERPVVPVRPAATTLGERIALAEQRLLTVPDDLGTRATLGLLYVQQAAATGDASFYSLAERALSPADTGLDAEQPVVVALGTLALARHDFTLAEMFGQRAVSADAFDGDALAVLVDAQVELGRYTEAEASLQRLLDLDPDAAALARTSYLRELHGDLDGAAFAMLSAEQAATGDPGQRATLATFSGDLALGRGDLRTAEAAYARAASAAPALASLQLGQARLLVARGDLEGAAAALEARSLRSPDPAGATLLGEVREMLDDAAGAADAYALVRANDALLTAAGVTIDLESAIFEADHGDPVTALRYAEAARSERRTVFTADALAWALHRNGRSLEAVELLDESLALGTAAPHLHLHAASILEAAGDATRAADELRVTFEQSPWTVLALRHDAVELAARLGVEVPGTWQS
jgi:tetratricopeptide (TPR) repeat protein